MFVEGNLRNDKWLTNCSYNPDKSLIGNHLDALGKYLDIYSSKYEKVSVLHMECFCDNFKILIKQATSCKNPDYPTCIDLLLTNAPQSF